MKNINLMNKLLVLLYIILSYSLCKECTESDCETITLENGEERSHYACVPKDGSECELKLLCQYALTGDPDTTFQCTDYPAVHPDKICINNEGTCTEEYYCKTLPSDSGKTCSSYKVSDIAKYVCKAAKGTDEDEVNICSKYSLSESNNIIHTCQAAEQGSQKPCVEIPFCSYVTSQQGTEIDCSTYPLEITNGDTVCIPKEDDEYICQEKFLCNKVPKDTAEACKNFVLEEDKKYTHYCTNSDGTYACKSEQYQCKDVPKIPGATNIKCSSFLDSGKTATHVCIEDTTSQDKQCKEMKLCSEVEESDMTGITDCSSSFYYDENTYTCRLDKEGDKCEQVYLCGKAPETEAGPCSSFATSDEDLVCIGESVTDCSPKYLCGKVPKSKESEDGFNCATFPLSAGHNDEEYGCIKDTESTTYACKEEYLCEKANSGANDEECSKYPVKTENKGCVKDSASGKFCKEEDLCTKVTLVTATDSECNKYPVSFDKIKTHICVKNQEAGSSCVEKMLCEKKTDGGTDEECRELAVKVDNQGKYACIANTQNGASGCIEMQLCTEVINEGTVDCSKYPLPDTNKDTHICSEISNPTNKACEEIPKSGIDCEHAKKGENDKQCSGYKVSNENKRCAKNTDNSATNPCIEKDKCESKTTGATNDEICALLAVAKPGEEKCIKNPEGENCMLLSYCDYAQGNSDAECAKFALKDIEQNECKKKSDENKCEEVKKKTEDEPDGESGNDESQTGDKDESGADSDKTSSTTDKSQAGEGNQDTTKSTEGTTGKTDNDNDNSGNIINVAFGLSLINYVLFLF